MNGHYHVIVDPLGENLSWGLGSSDLSELPTLARILRFCIKQVKLLYSQILNDKGAD